MDLSIFTTPEAWISLVTLIFLEIVLGVDNIDFKQASSRKTAHRSQARSFGRHDFALHLLVLRKLPGTYDQAPVLA